MIKTILVALDPDTDTPVATRHAAAIASRCGAEVTGLAVVDMGSIESDTRGGGIGSMYLMDELRKNMTTEAREVARSLIQAFEGAMRDAGVRFDAHVTEGVPFERIVDDMKYHDLLVVGNEPHFFYSHPEEKTQTLSRVVQQGVAPVLVVRDDYQTVDSVLLAYDGSDPAARTVQQFAHLAPFGTDIELEVLHVYESGKEGEAELMLRLVKDYLAHHGFEARTTTVQGADPADLIVEHATRSGADAVAVGSHSVSKLRQMAFGSTTASLLDHAPVPLFLYH